MRYRILDNNGFLYSYYKTKKSAQEELSKLLSLGDLGDTIQVYDYDEQDWFNLS